MNQENKTKIEISTWTILKIALAILGVWFIYSIREVIFLFFIVLIIVAALGPLVDKMSKYIPRFLAVIILTIIFLGTLTAIGFLIIPPVINQIGQIAINLPVIFDKVGPFYEHIRDSISIYQESLLNLSSGLGQISTGIYSTTLGFISGIVGLVTILVLAFYMLLEQASLKQFLHQIVPIEHKEMIFDVVRKIGGKMGAWLRGQVSLMFIISIAYGITLSILGVPYALTLAVWGGLTEVIPYIGPWIGLVPAFIIAYTISPVKALIVLVIYILIQQLESQFLVPKIMGKAVGLSPVIIILALLAGAKLMGILGIIIAVPVAAAISVLLIEWPNIKKLREKF